MAGTLVTDSSYPKLLDAADVADANEGNGTAKEVNKCGARRAQLVVGTVSGTTPTLDVRIQASDSSTFASGVVELGAFPQLTDADADSTLYIMVDVQHRYVRSVTTVTGSDTPTFNDVTLTLEEPHYKRTKSDTAG